MLTITSLPRVQSIDRVTDDDDANVALELH